MLLWGWIREELTFEEISAGRDYCGCLSVPRELCLTRNAHLAQIPVPEVAHLRERTVCHVEAEPVAGCRKLELGEAAP